MKLVIKEKLTEAAVPRREQLKAAVMELNHKLGDLRIKMQELIPLEVAMEYFTTLPSEEKISKEDENKAKKIAEYAKNNQVRIGDIFNVADELNNMI